MEITRIKWFCCLMLLISMFSGCVSSSKFLKINREYEEKIGDLNGRISTLENDINHSITYNQGRNEKLFDEIREELTNLKEIVTTLKTSLKKLKTDEVDLLNVKVEKIVDTIEKIRLRLIKLDKGNWQ